MKAKKPRPKPKATKVFRVWQADDVTDTDAEKSAYEQAVSVGLIYKKDHVDKYNDIAEGSFAVTLTHDGRLELHHFVSGEYGGWRTFQVLSMPEQLTLAKLAGDD